MPRKRALGSAVYMHDMAAKEQSEAMIYWVAEAAKEAREEANRLQVHIAAEMDKNQSTVARFEDHTSTPRNVDAMIAAYGRDLDLDPRQLWARALELWIAADQPTADDAARGLRVAAARAADMVESPSPPKRQRRSKN